MNNPTLLRDVVEADLSHITAIENMGPVLLGHQISSYYPIPAVSLFSNDPPNITPEVKALLRIKTRLMRLGRIDEASICA